MDLKNFESWEARKIIPVKKPQLRLLYVSRETQQRKQYRPVGSETGFWIKTKKSYKTGLGLPITGGGAGRTGEAIPPNPPPNVPHVSVQNSCFGTAWATASLRTWCTKNWAASGASGYRYKKHLRNPQQNSCPQNATRRGSQTVRLYFASPMASATSERTFSALRRLKTYLRSTIKKDRVQSWQWTTQNALGKMRIQICPWMTPYI